MSNTFEVVFKGEIIDGFDTAETRQKIGKLFNADEAKINRLFSGNNVVIKKNLDQATANKYITAFKNAGAIAVVRNAAAESQPTETPATAKPVAAQPNETASSSAATSQSATAFEHSGEASAHLSPAPQTQIQLDSNPDLSSLSLREANGNLVDPGDEVAPVDIDTSGFSLAASGVDLADKKEEPAPLNADLSGMSLLDN
ncbi:MAG: hypothetical protein OEY36_08150 [Gammaproteobacteria bacterium]|nr:hypothetical protein [Gammaproteobacteria bacterium]